ncbi:MAG: hypothetical protein IT379_21620 [Deltaproteobacteria bacterium]|nr:hypothetical protein [Deltaproteobacteria bacterium]
MVKRVGLAALGAASMALPSMARACPTCQLDANGNTWWLIGTFMVTPWFVVLGIALLLRWLRKLEQAEDVGPAEASEPGRVVRRSVQASSAARALPRPALRVVEPGSSRAAGTTQRA